MGAVLILISAGGLYLLLSLTGYNDNFAGVVVLLAGALALVARGSYWRYFTGKNTQGVFTPRQNTGPGGSSRQFCGGTAGVYAATGPSAGGR